MNFLTELLLILGISVSSTSIDQLDQQSINRLEQIHKQVIILKDKNPKFEEKLKPIFVIMTIDEFED